MTVRTPESIVNDTDTSLKQRSENGPADSDLGLVIHLGASRDEHQEVACSTNMTNIPMTLARVISELKARRSSNNEVPSTIPSPSTSTSSGSFGKSSLTTASSPSTTSLEVSTDYSFSSNEVSPSSTTSYETAITKPTCVSEPSNSASFHSDSSELMNPAASVDDDTTSPDRYRALLSMTLEARKCAMNWKKMAVYWEQRARRAEVMQAKSANAAVTPSVSDVSDVSIPLEPARAEAVRQLTRARAETATSTCTSPVHQLLLDRLISESSARAEDLNSSLEVDTICTSQINEPKIGAQKAPAPAPSNPSTSIAGTQILTPSRPGGRPGCRLPRNIPKRVPLASTNAYSSSIISVARGATAISTLRKVPVTSTRQVSRAKKQSPAPIRANTIGQAEKAVPASTLRALPPRLVTEPKRINKPCRSQGR